VTGGRYLVGIAMLLLAIVPVAVATRRTRRYLLPDWAAPESYVVESVVFLAIVLAICEVLGAAGLFGLWAVVIACVVVGLLVEAVLGGRAVGASAVPTCATSVAQNARYRRWSSWIAVSLVAVVATTWFLRTGDSSRGIVGLDSLNYHLPFAGRFLQQGHTLPLHYTTIGEETPFDPANSELLLAFFMLPFHRDVLAPVLNLGWMALALLAAWCVGRRRGVGELTLASGAVLIAAPLMIYHDAGTASNDIVTIALLLSAVAVLLNSDGRLEAIGVAGAAAGLGLATKLTLAVPIAVLSVGLILAARAGHRRRTVLAWSVPLVLTGGYWYARNFVVIGNPVPALHLGVGSWRLPSPRMSAIDHEGFTVAHYVGDGKIWHDMFVPFLRHGFGPLWWLVFGLAATGSVLSLFRGDRLLRVLGLAAIVAFLAYLFTPTGAAGPRGFPLLFGPNLRFVFPAIGLGLVLLPLSVADDLGPISARVLLVLFVVPLAAERGWGSTGVVVALVVAAAALSGVWFRLESRARRLLARVVAAVGVIVVVCAGFVLQRNYLADRYVNAIAGQAMFIDGRSMNALYRWARGVTDARIAVVSLVGAYPLSGLDLSNYVQTIGDHGHAGSFEAVSDCRELRRQIDVGRYDYIVTGAELTPGEDGRQASWIVGAAVREVLRVGPVTVLKVVGYLDPNQCPADA
jgi:hypothetical protein